MLVTLDVTSSLIAIFMERSGFYPNHWCNRCFDTLFISNKELYILLVRESKGEIVISCPLLQEHMIKYRDYLIERFVERTSGWVSC